MIVEIFKPEDLLASSTRFIKMLANFEVLFSLRPLDLFNLVVAVSLSRAKDEHLHTVPF